MLMIALVMVEKQMLKIVVTAFFNFRRDDLSVGNKIVIERSKKPSF